MPTYKITDPATNRVIRVTGDSPPTETELNQIFSAIRTDGGSAPTRKPWDATGVSFGGQAPPAAKRGTQRDVMGIASPRERQTPVVTPSRQTVGRAIRPVLEGGGAVAGGALGGTLGVTGGPLAPLTVPGAAVAGAAGGYAAGSGLANLIEGPTANQVNGRPMTAGEQTARIGKNLLTGAELEMGGQIGGKLIGSGVNALRSAKVKGLPFSDKRNAWRAAGQFAESQAPATPEATLANQKRAAETRGVINRLQPGVTPTPGQASGNFKSAALEQSMTSKDAAFAERLKYNDAQLTGAAVNKLTGALGKPAELPAVQPASVTGANQVKAIRKAMEPVLSKEAEMWSEVPEYPMPASNFEAKGREMLGGSMVKSDRTMIKGIMDYSKGVPRTVQGLQDVERTIGGAISETKNPNTRRLLGQLKDAVKADFEAMGEAAETGDVALHNGQIVYPSKLRSELAGVDRELATAEQARVTSKPDFESMRKQLSAKQAPLMQRAGETPEAFNSRIVRDYQRVFPGRERPMVGVPTPDRVTELTSQKQQLTDMLADLQPAENVAAKYQAAKKYSAEEKFARFYRGAVQDVLEGGEQASGLRLSAEQIPPRLFTPQGSADLVKAVGKEEAAAQTMPYATEQLITKSVDANTGVMNVPRAVAWVRQNRAALDNLGLTRAVEQVIRGQVPRAIEAELETKAVDMLGNPAATTLQAAKLIKRFGPAVERFYGPNAMQALRDYGKMMEILGRNKYVSYAKGSTTAEKMGMGADMAEKVSALAAVASGHGWVFSATKNLAKGFMEPLLAANKRQINALLQEALVNPEAAEVLMKIAKTKPEKVSEMSVKLLKPLILQLGIAATQPTAPRGQVDDQTP